MLNQVSAEPVVSNRLLDHKQLLTRSWAIVVQLILSNESDFETDKFSNEVDVGAAQQFEFSTGSPSLSSVIMLCMITHVFQTHFTVASLYSCDGYRTTLQLACKTPMPVLRLSETPLAYSHTILLFTLQFKESILNKGPIWINSIS